jgi:predicted RNase H-like nuclease (RuvC/YqgF family)
MAKIIGKEEPQERELTQEDIMEMARYIQHLEGIVKNQQEQIEQLKTYAITLATQRNNAEKRYKGLQTEVIEAQQPFTTTINIDGDIVQMENPSEQYREIKQF